MKGVAGLAVGMTEGMAASEGFQLTRTVANHLDEVIGSGTFKGEMTRLYINSTLTVREIMAAGKPISDPGGFPGALRWDVPGAFRGKSGVWQLVVHPETDTILHFLFK